MIICTNKDFEKVLNEKATQLDTTANARDFISDYVYQGNTNYIDECITEFSENNVDIYTDDLLEWLSSCDDACDFMEEALEYVNDGLYPFTTHIMVAQGLANANELQNELEDENNLNWFRLWALSLADNINELAPDHYNDVIEKALDVDIDIYGNRVDTIIDEMGEIINDYFARV